MNNIEKNYNYIKHYILYEDNHIIVIVKDFNIPVQKDSSNDISLIELIKDYLKFKYNKPGNVFLGIVHRLDRPVGGILVFAKTSKAAKRLSKAMIDNKIKKIYYAIVENICIGKNILLKDYLWKDKERNIVKIASPIDIKNKKAKLCKLIYSTIETNKEKNISLLEINLLTGRSHQIRVQISNINHSIVGDVKYFSKTMTRNIALWSYNLEFEHPIKKEKMSFKKLPPDIEPFKFFKY